MMITAQRLRQVRKSLGDTQAAFALRFGLNQATVSRGEDEAYGPPTEKLAQAGLAAIIASIMQDVA